VRAGLRHERRLPVGHPVRTGRVLDGVHRRAVIGALC
jgi:hypothetical protein